MKRKIFATLALVAMLVGILFPSAIPAYAKKAEGPVLRPMIFVHGYMGSVSSFATQFLRFASNGYPINYLVAFEYDSTRYLTNPSARPQIRADLDALINSVIGETGAEQIDLLGHSLGTSLCQAYLNDSPERAAKVAHYVNLDGTSSSSLPGGVSTLAIWGRGSPTRQIVGATNVYFPNCSHSQVVGIAETFSQIYNFFNGELPVTTDIVPEPRGQVRLAGRVIFASGGATSATLEIWEIDADTGYRIGKKPEAVYQIGADGNWGPFKAKGGAHYEYCVMSEGLRTIHTYSQPPIRSNYWVRLTYYGVTAMATSPNHCLFYLSRNKEWWGDPAGLNSDVLLINGINIINPVNVPMSSTINTIVVTDNLSDGVSHLDVYDSPQMFAVRVDYVVPAADPPDETIHLVLYPRGGGGTQVMNVPNWASSQHSIAVGFNEFDQDIITWDEYVKVK
jgi:hypothetical protein